MPHWGSGRFRKRDTVSIKGDERKVALCGSKGPGWLGFINGGRGRPSAGFARTCATWLDTYVPTGVPPAFPSPSTHTLVVPGSAGRRKGRLADRVRPWPLRRPAGSGSALPGSVVRRV